MVQIIMSGGQTGADRAALDFAISRKIPHHGWCPKGRLAEDGPLNPIYKLTETSSDQYPPRTEKNVQHSDGTVIFNQQEGLERGCALTERMCMKHQKPCLLLVGIGSDRVEEHARNVSTFIMRNRIEKLNVAGNRESKQPGMYNHVFAVLSALPPTVMQPTFESRWEKFLTETK